jgi:O-antigen/teichoic acid export membrane protein
MIRSLIMTRLLFPEVYGLMVLVWVVLFGLQMFADTGITATIIRDPRGDEPDFLNTAFTTNVLRGLLLWIVCCALAYPIASLYGQPSLAQLLPATGLTALVHGFVSTSIYVRRRHMDFKRLTILSLATELVTFAVVVSWAWFFPNVWAMVASAVAGEIFQVVASHLYLPGIRNRFRWDRSALDTFMVFGKWMYLSSVVYFLSTQGDRFMLGKYLDMPHLGIYGTATVLSGAIQTLVLKINSDVLYPAYSRVLAEGAERLKLVVRRVRLVGDLCMIVPIAMTMVLGPLIVDLLYDHRYHDAGWMLQVLCIRLLIVAVVSNGESCLVAMGQPKYGFVENLCRAIAIVIAIPLGWWWGGVHGVIWAIALSELAPLMVVWSAMIRHQMFDLAAELRSAIFVGVGVLLGLGVAMLWSQLGIAP